MSWFKIDDGWWAHPKTLALSPEAIALWTRAGSWASQQLTDGYISTQTLRIFGYRPKAVRELVDVGYWEEVPAGYQFHDWNKYQPTAESVKENRERSRERMRNVRANKRESLSNPDPTRPDPTLFKEPDGSLAAPKRSSKRALSVPADFQITEAMKTWAMANAPDVNLAAETGKFLDWHTAKGSTMKDWTAAWRTWMRKAEEFLRDKAKTAAPANGTRATWGW